MAGRPAKYATVEQLETAIADYFNPIVVIEQETKLGKTAVSEERRLREKPTLTGLALHLGFESRQSIYDYEENGEFSYTIKRARLAIECAYEEKLHDGSCAGAIFALKNFGWKDKTEVDNRYPDGVRVKHVYQDGNETLDG